MQTPTEKNWEKVKKEIVATKKKYTKKKTTKTPPGTKLRHDYHYQHFETVREQLLDAGFRLAATLNAIFDPAD
mgnify:CR=1 FL=1